MFGLFNRLTLFLCFAFIISCKEDNRNPIYKDIPAKYNHIFKKLRSLNNTSIISVISNNGLIDQLNLSPYSTDKKYVSMFSNYGIPGAEDQQFFFEYYHQTFVPVLYQFYEINYSIDFLNRRYIEADVQDPENYYAEISIQGKDIFKISLINSTIISDYPYERLINYTIDGIVYNELYSLNITDADELTEIKKVYFTLSEGIVQFETNANEIFNIRL